MTLSFLNLERKMIKMCEYISELHREYMAEWADLCEKKDNGTATHGDLIKRSAISSLLWYHWEEDDINNEIELRADGKWYIVRGPEANVCLND